MRHLMRVAAVLLLGLAALIPATVASAGDQEEYARCTSEIPRANGEVSRVCMRIYYNDQGNTVVLKKIEYYVTNPREIGDEGYKIEDVKVQCLKANGTVDYTWYSADSFGVSSDHIVLVRNWPNEQCNESRVRFQGFGVMVFPFLPDTRDEFGNENGWNYLPVD